MCSQLECVRGMTRCSLVSMECVRSKFFSGTFSLTAYSKILTRTFRKLFVWSNWSAFMGVYTQLECVHGNQFLTSKLSLETINKNDFFYNNKKF